MFQQYPLHSRLFDAVSRYPRLVLAIALVLSAASVFYTTQHIKFLTGRDDLMPRNAPFQRDYRAYQDEFGDQEEIVVVVEGEDAGLVTKFSDTLYGKLAAEKQTIRDLFYPGGLPFGLELSARPWHDGDLLGWAYAYEQATHHRHPPVLVESGLLPNAP